MTFDLPAQKNTFVAHHDWDFALTCQGQPIEVSMQEVEGLSGEAELALFKKVVLDVIEKKDAAVQLAAEQFFEEFLKKWNQEAPISRDEFMSRLKPASVTIEGDGSARLEFTDDHDMFWGHAIVVSFDPQSKIADAELLG